MNPRQLARLRVAIEVKRAQLARQSARPFIPHKPHPKQAEFLSLTCLEALYGGAAGGGKSDALLMAALEYVHVPGYAALILRRTFRDLNQPDAIMARSHEWLRNSGAKWNERDKRWTFPSGATLTFGYCDTEKDKFQYQGAALQFIGWDELTQFPNGWYLWMFSRLRKLAGSGVPLRVRAATNPGGIGHDWVKKRFVEPGDPTRPFVPARLDDNPSVDADSYRISLAQLDPASRDQMEHGKWVRDSGGLVYRYDDGRNLITHLPEGGVWTWLLGLDFGIRDLCAATIAGWREHDPCTYIPRSYRFAADPAKVAEEVTALEQEYEFARIVGDLGGLGAVFGEDLGTRFGIPVEAAKKADKLGGIRLLNGDLGRGRVKVVRDSCSDLLAEWDSVPWNEKNTREAEGFVCDASDSALYVYRASFAFGEREKPPPKTEEQVRVAEEAAIVERLATEQPREWWEQK